MVKNKLPGKGTTIFTIMSKMAQDEGAINLSQGFPDFDGPQALRERVAYHMDHGHNQYAPLGDYSAISDEPDTEFATRLTRYHKVAVIPVSVFYKDAQQQQVIRFCFAKHDDTLRQAAERLQGVLG